MSLRDSKLRNIKTDAPVVIKTQLQNSDLVNDSRPNQIVTVVQQPCR
ncbi:hypothetical protein Rcae01_00240 [Novipirellula caenicola]|uniref:Uncharacterized protein n=1 Tax=Novipirellula caenicola TaxID=1536901 RepID=A0ABP9VJE5_9BACT